MNVLYSMYFKSSRLLVSFPSLQLYSYSYINYSYIIIIHIFNLLYHLSRELTRSMRRLLNHIINWNQYRLNEFVMKI